MTAIIYHFLVKTTPETLLKTISTPEGIAGWWTPDSTWVDQLDRVFQVVFGTFAMRFAVEVNADGKHVDWTPVMVPEHWASPIAFDILPGGRPGWCALRFTQTGYADDNVANYNYLWAQYMRSLKVLIESGTGEPFGTPASLASGTQPPKMEAA